MLLIFQKRKLNKIKNIVKNILITLVDSSRVPICLSLST